MLKKSIYPSLFLLILLFSCNRSTKKDFVIFPKGGYAYPKVHNPLDSDFYWYPLKKLMTPEDSIFMIYGGADLYKSFDEPNLSLRPESKIRFRLICGNPATIINITDSELIIKQARSGSAFAYTDEKKLTESENEDLNFLRYNYPLKEKNTNHSLWRNKWLDSLVKARPELLMPRYYLSLLEKGKTFGTEKFTYDTKKISISHAAFKRIVDTIGASGYWSHSYQVSCESHPTDGSSYILEANTSEKYNMVRVDDCETNYSPIASVYQYLINLVEVGDKVHITGTR